MATQNEWNFIFLIYADLRVPSRDIFSDPFKFDTLTNLLKIVPLQENTNLFIIENKMFLDEDNDLTRDTFICTRRTSIGSEILSELEEVKNSNQKPPVIGKILHLIKTTHKSRRTILFTWDHGSVFGINKVAPIVVNTEFNTFKFRGAIQASLKPTNYYINPIIFRKSVHESFIATKSTKAVFTEDLGKKVINPTAILSSFLRSDIAFFNKRINSLQNMHIDHLSNENSCTAEIDMLTNEMLRDAIAIGFGNEKIDIVCMMNCNMQNLHTQYALKDNVQFLVAPQSWIYFPGYDYMNIFNDIFKSPKISAKNLAWLIVDNCRKDSIKQMPLVGKAIYESIFAVDLAFIDVVTSLFDDIFTFELKKIKEDVVHKKVLRTLLGEKYIEYEDKLVQNYSLIDLRELYRMRTSPYYPGIDSAINIKYNEILWRFSMFIVNRFDGKIFHQKTHLPSGICMSLPGFRTYKDPNERFIKLFHLKGSPFQSSFIRNFAIDDFFEELYK